MTTAQIEAIRSRSKSKDNGPWMTDWVEMAKKTVLRRLFKMLPVSVEVQTKTESRAISLETIANDDAITIKDFVNLPMGFHDVRCFCVVLH
jgi:recombination protein RecT